MRTYVELLWRLVFCSAPTGVDRRSACCPGHASRQQCLHVVVVLRASCHAVHRLRYNTQQRCIADSAPQGRLNQWAHWARAQGPRIFFLFEGPPTGCGEIIC